MEIAEHDVVDIVRSWSHWLSRAFVGRSREPDIRCVEHVDTGGQHVHVLVGGSHPGEFEGAMLSDRLTLHDVRDIVAFASRQSLPIGAWVLWGVTRQPRRIATVAQWMACLAREADDTAVIVPTATMPERRRTRLMASLRRCDCRVHTSTGDATA